MSARVLSFTKPFKPFERHGVPPERGCIKRDAENAVDDLNALMVAAEREGWAGY